ncbi:MAG: N-acyl homoserine lactonase family protein [Anaerolineae bacterium]
MKIHAISTGRVKITKSWQTGNSAKPGRLLRAIFDKEFTEWLPVFCFVIEHQEGLIVVDTGIPKNANDRVWIPPFMPLIQRAAPFDIQDQSEEIGPQMVALGLDPNDVRWLIQTHLHQDHEGGFHYFPNAEVLVSRTEWEAAAGLSGRLGGYFNFRWPKDLNPTLIDFEDGAYKAFACSQSVTQNADVILVPTPGHSVGHLSVIIDEGEQLVILAGDAAYSQALLLNRSIDGMGPSPADQQDSHQRILEMARQTPTVFVPSHEWAGRERLEARTPVFSAEKMMA